MKQLNEIDKTIDDAISKFGSSIPGIEKNILGELRLLIKDLDIDKAGNIRTNSANIKKVGNIRKKLEKIVFSKSYIKDVTEFVKSFNTVASFQNKDFIIKPTPFVKNVQQVSIDMVVDNLTESGMNANIVEPIRKVLIQNVTAGGSYSELADYLDKQLRPVDGKGLISKYVYTIATDSINTFSRTYNSVMSEEAGYEWYTYRNSLKETSREFCIHMVQKRYFHKSEIPALLRGEVDGHQCKIYEATGLPYGMKADTNDKTFLMYAGGWNCGHQIMGIPESAVPKDIVSRFKNIQNVDKLRKEFNSYSSDWNKAYFNEKTGGFNVYHKDHQFTSTAGGGDAEITVGKLLADKLGKQVEFLPENGKGKGVPDMKFDGHTWDVKFIDNANPNTIRTYIKDARKADRAIFYYTNEKYQDLRFAMNREIGRFKAMNRIMELPDIYYMDKGGLLKLLWKK